MNNYQYPNPQMLAQSQYQQIQQMFPQPQGSVYSINSPIEIGNVPIGSTGLSVVLCLSEDIMYIKSFQNGAPVIMAYRVSPYQKEAPQSNSTSNQKAADTKTSQIEERLEKIEKCLSDLSQTQAAHTQDTQKGGKFDGVI